MLIIIRTTPFHGSSPDDMPLPRYVLPLNNIQGHPKYVLLSVDPVDPSSWLRLAASTKVKFYSITNGSTRRYIESLYNKYTTNYRSDAFSNAIIKLEALHGSIRRCEEALLQLTGVGREFRVAEAVGKLVNEGLRCVEEIACYASIGKGEVCELYEKRELMFQSLTYLS